MRAARRWLEKEPPHSILTWKDLVSKFINEFFPPSRTTNLRNEISNFQQRFDESFHEAWDHYKDLLRPYPHHGFTKLHQLDTFYNALNPADQDSLNSDAGGNLFKDCLAADGNTFSEFRDNIQGYVSAVTVNYNQGNSGYRPPSVANQIQPPCFAQPNVQNNQNRFSQPQGYNRGNIFSKDTSYQAPIQQNQVVPLRPLPSNTIANPKGKLKATTTRSGLVLDGPSVPMPPPFINPEEDERTEETLTDPELAEYTIKVPPPLVQKAKPVILKKLLEKLGDSRKFLIPCGFSELKYKALTDLERSSSPPHLGKTFLRTARALIDVHIEEMILCDGNERLTLNMRHDTSSYSNQPHKESINMINIYNDSYEDYLKDLFATNHLSGNPIFSSHTNLTSLEVINPLSGNTTFSSPDHLLEDTDELALITSPPGNDDLPFDIEFDLREIEYLLNHDPTKKMDSILEDSIDKCNLVDPNNDLVDTIPEMFTDEHTLDYSYPPLDTIPEMFTDEHTLDYSYPPLYDDVDDDLVELESDNDNVYDDPFDSEEDKIKESKLLIDELDPPRSSDFLPSPECDLVLYEDFSEVDALPLTNNEDKVFNPGILIHENLDEVTIRVTPVKNVQKISISNASLILEDFNPPLYELPFHKEVPRSETLLSFSSKNEEKVFNLGILTSKGVHTSFLSELSHRAFKLLKSLKILKARWIFFPALMKRTSVFWMFRVSISIPH
nr:reverse transcriptase domain-containing protein [Tanacetum cinerariifolium]